ncbi:hypothetical protein [Arthrobacter sp. M4]|uniref:hypothetical protein n=1 Tax=Arthrobacter sp. M4 TaxID=218160 RepID=UPI001CDB63E2|nr:hypothetical protein [Arthrobacter sp. M4]MCA4135057.1 hypothetical protein [Arthrobacter sp. M4]
MDLTVVVEQLAALLRGGRSPARLWEELWLVHGGLNANSPAESVGDVRSGRLPAVRQTSGFSNDVQSGMVTRRRMDPTSNAGRSFSNLHGIRGAPNGGVGATAGATFEARSRPTLPSASLSVLAAARGAAALGAPIADTIRTAAMRSIRGHSAKERRVWIEIAACFDVAETSGCPLANVLARFAAQLEAERDSEAARRTALAGPRATVKLLGWLPLMGLGLGTLLGVDPLGVLMGSPGGAAALAAGLVLTIAGRAWSSKLVRAAAS